MNPSTLKLKKNDKELISKAVACIRSGDLAGLLSLLPNLVERELLNFSRAYPLDNTLFLFALSKASQNGNRVT